MASQFVGDGIVYQAFEQDGTSKNAEVQPGGLATDIPLVVLADGNTASSAEIVTGAIQDAKRGEVVGEKTFGTGTVLGRFDLADGSSLRIGVERWLTRNGRPIWHEGLDPDVKVDLPAEHRAGRARQPARHDRGRAREVGRRAAQEGRGAALEGELSPGPAPRRRPAGDHGS